MKKGDKVRVLRNTVYAHRPTTSEFLQPGDIIEVEQPVYPGIPDRLSYLIHWRGKHAEPNTIPRMDVEPVNPSLADYLEGKTIKKVTRGPMGVVLRTEDGNAVALITKDVDQFKADVTVKKTVTKTVEESVVIPLEN